MLTNKQINKIVRLSRSPRGATRAKRRAAGDFNPVNEAASLAQHPNGKFARSGTTVNVVSE